MLLQLDSLVFGPETLLISTDPDIGNDPVLGVSFNLPSHCIIFMYYIFIILAIHFTCFSDYFKDGLYTHQVVCVQEISQLSWQMQVFPSMHSVVASNV